MEKFAVGVIVGMLGGALLVANNYKMRTLVKKGQAEIGAKLDKLMDEKIEQLEKGAKNVKEKVEEKAEELIEKKPKSARKSTAKKAEA